MPAAKEKGAAALFLRSAHAVDGDGAKAVAYGQKAAGLGRGLALESVAAGYVTP
jgi:hypothetical protein